MPTDRAEASVRDASSARLQEKLRMASDTQHSPRQNHLLNALPHGDYERLAPQLESHRTPAPGQPLAPGAAGHARCVRWRTYATPETHPVPGTTTGFTLRNIFNMLE
jgi:hypothetical protein